MVGIQAPAISGPVMYSFLIHDIQHLKQPIRKLLHLPLLMFVVECGKEWNTTQMCVEPLMEHT
jgi:hypothetical protein